MTMIKEKIHAIITRSKMAEKKELTGRYFLVTGCAEHSLGFATAKQLLSQGGKVTITVRQNSQQIVCALKDQLPSECHEHLCGFEVDLANRDSVNNFTYNYRQSGWALDVLINNAGIHLDLMSKWTEPQCSEDGHEIQWRVNYLGTTHLTHCLLPLLKASAQRSGDSRVINVVSHLHNKGLNSEFFQSQRPYNSWNAYGQSKLALVHFTRSIDKHFASDGITSYCLHPGAVYTNVAAKGLANTGWIETLRNLLSPIEKLFLKTAKEGAQTQIHCATDDKQDLKSGGYYRNLQLAIASSEADDSEMAEQLWEELQLGLKNTSNKVLF